MAQLSPEISSLQQVNDQDTIEDIEDPTDLRHENLGAEILEVTNNQRGEQGGIKYFASWQRSVFIKNFG